jgi:hypothetical protein
MLRVPILLHGLQPILLLLKVSQSYLLENSFFCSSNQQLGQLASEDELCSEEVATVHVEEVGTVDEEAEDDVASHCNESRLTSNSTFHLFWHVFCCPHSHVSM